MGIIAIIIFIRPLLRYRWENEVDVGERDPRKCVHPNPGKRFDLREEENSR
jgi:hypothetical protein